MSMIAGNALGTRLDRHWMHQVWGTLHGLAPSAPASTDSLEADPDPVSMTTRQRCQR